MKFDLKTTMMGQAVTLPMTSEHISCEGDDTYIVRCAFRGYQFQFRCENRPNIQQVRQLIAGHVENLIKILSLTDDD